MRRFVKARVDLPDERDIPVILDLATGRFAAFLTERTRNNPFDENGDVPDPEAVKRLAFSSLGEGGYRNLRPEGEPE